MSHRMTAASVRRYLREHPELPPPQTWASLEPVGAVVLVLPWPPSENHRLTPVGRGQQIKKAEVRAYCAIAEEKIALQHRGYAPLSGRLQVVVEFHQADRRRRDIANLSKDLLDCCARVHVYHDDEQIDDLRLQRFRQCERPYIRLTIDRLV